MSKVNEVLIIQIKYFVFKKFQKPKPETNEKKNYVPIKSYAFFENEKTKMIFFCFI